MADNRRERLTARDRKGPIVDREPRLPAHPPDGLIVSERKRGRDANTFHARHRSDLFEAPFDEGEIGLIVGVVGEHLHGETVLGIEAQRVGQQAIEAAEEQPRADREHQSGGDLCDNQPVPESIGSWAV